MSQRIQWTRAEELKLARTAADLLFREDLKNHDLAERVMQVLPMHRRRSINVPSQVYVIADRLRKLGAKWANNTDKIREEYTSVFGADVATAKVLVQPSLALDQKLQSTSPEVDITKPTAPPRSSLTTTIDQLLQQMIGTAVEDAVERALTKHLHQVEERIISKYTQLAQSDAKHLNDVASIIGELITKQASEILDALSHSVAAPTLVDVSALRDESGQPRPPRVLVSSGASSVYVRLRELFPKVNFKFIDASKMREVDAAARADYDLVLCSKYTSHKAFHKLKRYHERVLITDGSVQSLADLINENLK